MFFCVSQYDNKERDQVSYTHTQPLNPFNYGGGRAVGTGAQSGSPTSEGGEGPTSTTSTTATSSTATAHRTAPATGAGSSNRSNSNTKRGQPSSSSSSSARQVKVAKKEEVEMKEVPGRRKRGRPHTAPVEVNGVERVDGVDDGKTNARERSSNKKQRVSSNKRKSPSKSPTRKSTTEESKKRRRGEADGNETDNEKRPKKREGPRESSSGHVTWQSPVVGNSAGEEEQPQATSIAGDNASQAESSVSAEIHKLMTRLKDPQGECDMQLATWRSSHRLCRC